MEQNLTNIAMRCTQSQFDHIKSKLQSTMLIFSFEIYPYLANNIWDGDIVSNILDLEKSDNSRIVFEEWNEQIFLQYASKT